MQELNIGIVQTQKTPFIASFFVYDLITGRSNTRDTVLNTGNFTLMFSL